MKNNYKVLVFVVNFLYFLSAKSHKDFDFMASLSML